MPSDQEQGYPPHSSGEYQGWGSPQQTMQPVQNYGAAAENASHPTAVLPVGTPHEYPQQAEYGQPMTPPAEYGVGLPFVDGQQTAIPPSAGFAGVPPGPKNTRSGALVAVLIVAAVLVAATLIAGALVVLKSASSTAEPADVVETYLDALAKGDAEKALAQGKKPATATFVTSDILKKQQKLAKISDVSVVDTNTVGDTFADVHVTYKFGSRLADVNYSLEKAGDRWQMRDTTIDIDTSTLSNAPDPTLFGVPIAENTKVYVFPGPLAWGSKNANFDVSSRSDEFSMGTGLSRDYRGASLETELSDAGKKAAEKAVSTKLVECARSDSTAPKGCPQRVFGGIDGTVKWTAPQGPLDLEFSYLPLDKGDKSVRVSGSTTWSAAYQTRRGPETDPTVQVSIYGAVDLSSDTPRFEPGY